MNDEAELDKIKSFRDLKAWQEAHTFVLMIYKMTKTFPKAEIFGLTSQMRRAAVSITSNVAEGFSRQSYAEKVQFYSIAQGSNTELQNQMLISKDIGYLRENDFNVAANQSMVTHKLLNGLIKKSKSIRDASHDRITKQSYE